MDAPLVVLTHGARIDHHEWGDFTHRGRAFPPSDLGCARSRSIASWELFVLATIEDLLAILDQHNIEQATALVTR